MWKIGNVEIKNRIVFAPMAGVSDIVYRKIIKKMNAGLIYTEMVSIMGIAYNNKKTIDMLKINNLERPISLQIFGSDIESFVSAAKYIEKNIKPDIIDINMGCPVPKVAGKSGGGSALLKTPDKVYEIIRAITSNIKTPVTVKIRAGWDKDNINAVQIAQLAEQAGASAICIHPRTKTQGFTGISDWSLIKDVKKNVSIPVIGNGDIKTIYDTKRMLDETKCDAIMIGRESLGNPWFINECVKYVENGKIIEKPDDKTKIKMIKSHFNLLIKEYGEKKALLLIRTHAIWYLKGISKMKPYKTQLVNCNTKKDFLELIDNLYKMV